MPRWSSLSANARLSFYLGLINLFSLRDGRNYARRNSGKQGEMFFIYVRLSFRRQRQRALHFPQLLRLHPYCNGNGAERQRRNITINAGASTDSGECGNGSWNFYERPVSKFPTLRKIRYFSVRDRVALSHSMQKFRYHSGDMDRIVITFKRGILISREERKMRCRSIIN